MTYAWHQYSKFVAVFLLLVVHLQVQTCLCCTESHWERRLDADLSAFEDLGIHTDDISYAAEQVCGGYMVSIVDNQVYAFPLGWEATPKVRANKLKHPHQFLLMFSKLLCEYEVPNIMFVLNAYDKLCKQDHRRKVPIISWGKDAINDDYQIMIPYSIVFHKYNSSVQKFATGPPWNERREVAIWRGSTTGGTFTNHTWQYFPRSQLVKACLNSTLCDAKFSRFPQSHEAARNAIKAMGGYGDSVSMADFLKYKYIIVNDGNMAPSSRLSIFLQSGSLLLYQESPCIEFFYDDLEPYVHYVPLSYNFGDVERKIMWARKHDAQAKAISENAMAYARTYFTEYHLNCYLYRLITRYHSAQRFTAGFVNESFTLIPKKCGNNNDATTGNTGNQQ